MDDRYLDELRRKVELYNGPRLHRFIKSPFRVVYIKMLQAISDITQISIKIQIKTFWNQEMTVLFPEGMSAFISRFGFYEENLSFMMLQYLKEGMTFFDVGAHFGYYTLLASNIVGDRGGVYSFEPSDVAFRILETNARKRRNIHCEKLVVYSRRTLLTLYDYGIKFSGLNTVLMLELMEQQKKD